jgi:hypothetical protein
MTTMLGYNDANQQTSEQSAGGSLDAVSISSGYDGFLRRNDLSAQYSTTPILHHTFAFDLASRLQTVTALDPSLSPLSSAEYSYVANSPLVSQVLFRQSGTPKMTTTKTYDLLNRLTAITNSPAGAGQRRISSAYQYNSANQRTALTNAENGTYWVYIYDSLGQVTSGKKYWSDNNSPVAGQQFEYVFDDIGNRSSTKAVKGSVLEL